MITFTVIAALAVVSPGADTLLVVRSVMARGARAGLWTTAGICLGCTVHATLSAVGVSVLLTQSPRAYMALKAAGAAYLFFLGVTSLGAAISPRQSAFAVDHGPVRSTGFRDGLVVNVLNPKVSLFYLALVPQFVTAGAPVLWSYATLTGIHILLGAAWFSIVSLVLGRIRAWLMSAATRRVIDGAAGAIMILLASRVMWTL